MILARPARRTHPAGDGYGFASVQNAFNPSALFDIEGRWWRARELDNALPVVVETEEKLDLFRAFHSTDEFHGSFAAGTWVWIGSPDFEDEVAALVEDAAEDFGDGEDELAVWNFVAAIGAVKAEKAGGNIVKILVGRFCTRGSSFERLPNP